MARPSKYDAECLPAITKLCELGATDRDIADFLEIRLSTLYKWKLENDAFSDALKRGKETADNAVQDRLFKRATGYSFEAVKIFMPAGAKEPVYAPYTEHVPPDTTAMIFWLKNRRPDEWRDKREVATTVTMLDEMSLDERRALIAALENITAEAGNITH